MYFGPNAKIALFIDGQFLYSASRNIGFDVDYRNLLELFRKQGLVVRAYYYVAMLETEEYSPLKPLTDWLAYNGYTLITKSVKEHTDGDGRRRVKGNMEVEIVCDMFAMAPRVSHLVLMSGNGDLVEAVRRVQRDAQVVVVSSIKTTPPMVSDELRRQADEFVELAEIAPEFTRRQRERVAREPVRTEPAVVVTPADPFGEALPEVALARRRRTATG
jgi:uncharacterized LabA/DUF88 family protein